jgi:L-amino acid N-acyltransferase YncA
MDDATRLSEIRRYRDQIAQRAERYEQSSMDWLDRSHRTRSEDRRRIYYQNFLIDKHQGFVCEAVAGRLACLLGERPA